MDIKEKFLPIGTVVMLKGGTKRVMISGFCSMAEEDQNVMYDYAGCMYPEGFLSSDQTALFNHEQIEKIYYMDTYSSISSFWNCNIFIIK
jgi:hypothetical protein